ncbi:ABC transporter permease [Streptomyces sp. NPDC026672]|uniref:ABC transporter permease n=1 Tax=unclassified Streptomyces TaxID=2593676 RepID=UPI0033E66A46
MPSDNASTPRAVSVHSAPGGKATAAGRLRRTSAGPADGLNSPRSTRPLLTRLVERSGFFHYSGLYALVIMVVVFAFWDAPYFWTLPTLKTVLVTSAIGGTVALGAVVPFAGNMLDLQFANVAGFSLALMTWLSLNVHANDGLLALVTIGAGTLFGLVSGLIVSGLRVSSLIVTLGVGTLAQGAAYYLIQAKTVQADLSPWFTEIGRAQVGPIPVPVIALAVLAVLLHVWLEHTASGRTLRLVGDNADAARMAGINVPKVELLSLTFSSFVAGTAGVIWCAQIGFGNSSNGARLLLPAISAILLGATQFRHRINVPGTLLAVVLIQTAVQGMQLRAGGSATWPSNLFAGTLLVLAICLVVWNGRRRVRLEQREAALREAAVGGV